MKPNGKQITIKMQSPDFWNNLPEHVKAGIQRGRKVTAAGKRTPREEVMKKYAKYL